MSFHQEDWDRLSSGLQPHERAERNELLPALRRAVDEGLSGEQRTVLLPSRFTARPPPRWDPAATRSTRHYSKRAASCAPAWQLPGKILRTVRDLPGSVRPGWKICSPQTRVMRGAI